MNEDIISKDKDIETVVYQILNECYHEFKQVYGDKHSEHIKELIESITDKVKKADLYYTGPIATAHSQMGVVYTDSDILSAVLKHEMWHVYNNSASDKDKSLTYIPERYMLKLEQSGYLKNLYTKTMEEYKEKFKDEPERLEYVLVDFDEFKNDKFDFGDSHIEMWTEWFNSQTHLKDMKQNFWDWGDGYFTKSRSSDSFYDAYINVASMISCIIPKEKLLEMYIQTTEYETEYSFPEMLDEFDERYIDALEIDEKDKYQYPYLKILMDIQTVDENARKNPEMARETLQSCMKTCFNAYLKKLDNIQDIDLNKAKEIYFQIKYMQEHMVWNIDISKMQDLDYIQSLNNVQDKFKTMLQELDLENPEVQQMLETIDYTAENPFKYIEDGEKITDRILSEQVNTKDCLISIGDYKAQINTNGIKDNLYSSLFVLLGEEKYNLLYENFQGDSSLSAKDNVLLKFHKKIEEATTDEEYIDIYNNIYNLYDQKLENSLNTNENIESVFKKYQKEIIELQGNGLFNTETMEYLPALEKVINLYKEKASEYTKKVDEITEQRIMEESKSRPLDIAKEWNERFANTFKSEFNQQTSQIDEQRNNQYLQYTQLEKENTTNQEYVITPEQIGKHTINVPAPLKRATSEKEGAIEQTYETVKY